MMQLNKPVIICLKDEVNVGHGAHASVKYECVKPEGEGSC